MCAFFKPRGLRYNGGEEGGGGGMAFVSFLIHEPLHSFFFFFPSSLPSKVSKTFLLCMTSVGGSWVAVGRGDPPETPFKTCRFFRYAKCVNGWMAGAATFLYLFVKHSGCHNCSTPLTASSKINRLLLATTSHNTVVGSQKTKERQERYRSLGE